MMNTYLIRNTTKWSFLWTGVFGVGVADRRNDTRDDRTIQFIFSIGAILSTVAEVRLGATDSTVASFELILAFDLLLLFASDLV